MNNPRKGFASVLLVIALVIILGGGAWWVMNKPSAPTPSESAGLPVVQQSTTTVSQTAAQPANVTLNVYFGKKDDSPDTVNCAHAVARTIPYTSAVGQAALTELFKGPTPSEKQQGYFSCFFHTDIVVKSLQIDNGTATVNLSKEYDEGCGGATACSAQARSAVTNTLKQFPAIKAVRIQVEGVPQTIGEGA